MSQSDITVWTNWIREETTAIMNQLDEELDTRGDPVDPFNGSANGVYQPLPTSFPYHHQCKHHGVEKSANFKNILKIR